MKKTTIIYWVFTIPLLLLMGVGAVPDILSNPEAVKLIHNQLDYPVYFVPMIGVAKLLGSIVLLIPRFPRIKEWVYAGFTFDLLSAMISIIAVGQAEAFGVIFMIVALGFVAISYICFHKLSKGKSAGTLPGMAL